MQLACDQADRSQYFALWTATLRSLIAAVVLLGLLWGTGNLILPRRGDLPSCSVSLFPIWSPSRHCRDRHPVRSGRARHRAGLHHAALGNPGGAAVSWRACHQAPFGRWRVGVRGLGTHVQSRLIRLERRSGFARQRSASARGRLLAVSIVCVRAHKWISTPFQLVFWESLLATGLLALLALLFDGIPRSNGRCLGASAALQRGMRERAGLLGDGDGQSKPAAPRPHSDCWERPWSARSALRSHSVSPSPWCCSARWS